MGQQSMSFHSACIAIWIVVFENKVVRLIAYHETCQWFDPFEWENQLSLCHLGPNGSQNVSWSPSTVESQPVQAMLDPCAKVAQGMFQLKSIVVQALYQQSNNLRHNAA